MQSRILCFSTIQQFIEGAPRCFTSHSRGCGSVRSVLINIEMACTLSKKGEYCNGLTDSLNRENALRNIQYLCPSISVALISTYHENVNLFIDGHTLSSTVGTAQGDPLAWQCMP